MRLQTKPGEEREKRADRNQPVSARKPFPWGILFLFIGMFWLLVVTAGWYFGLLSSVVDDLNK